MRAIFSSPTKTAKSHKETAAATKTKRSAGKSSETSSAMPIFLQRAWVFPKVKSGAAKNAHEQEADRVSAAVSNGDQASRFRPSLTAAASDGAFEQRSFAGKMIEANLTGSRGNGNPISDSARATMEDKLGTDFSQVRVHPDSKANRLSNTLGANAFTIGNDIYFNQNRYDPDSKDGQALLAHELVHVAQQGGKATGAVQCSMMESLPSGLGGFELAMQTLNTATNGGMQGTIKFFPDPNGPYSTEIALIQTLNFRDVGGRTTTPGNPVDWSHVGPGVEAPRNVVSTPSGTHVDILYGSQPPGSAPTPNYQQPAFIAANPSQQYLGWLRSPTDIREASMFDHPNANFDSDYNFETVAKGTDNQVIYGSLEWGFKIRSGAVQDEYRHPHAAESAEFDAALERFRGYYTHEPIVLYFDTDRDTPVSGEVRKLSDVNSYMGRYPDVRLQVDGYADETGPAAHNVNLSFRRANRVVAVLTRLGVDPNRIDSPAGFGATPLFSAGSPARAAGSLRANRRVVITFVRTASTPIVP